MVRTRFKARCVRFSVAAILGAALFGTGGVAHATCLDCIFYGPGAGTGASGNGDSAFGYSALTSGDSGGANSAIGYAALYANTTGNQNTAAGVLALGSNTAGAENSAVGYEALVSNTAGSENTAAGVTALSSNTKGGGNTAIGYTALQNSNGNGNIAIGDFAGYNLTTGDNNIDIGALGVAGESDIIRIGRKGTQTEAFVQGIYNSALTSLSPLPVVVNSNGRLGYMPSAARYKRDIRDMGDASNGLLKLRPVSFRYKQDPAGALQYGLIAEEVDRVYPELVAHGDDGKVEAVRYDLLPALLVNEVQKQAKEGKRKDTEIAALQRQIVSQQQQITALQKKDAQIDALAERMNALERQARLARPEHLASAMHQLEH